MIAVTANVALEDAQLKDAAQKGQRVVWRLVANAAKADLAAKGFADAAMQARRLVTQACGTDYFELCDVSPTSQQMIRFEGMLNRRLAGEPLQYVLRCWGFRGLDLLVNPAVLIPRPETEGLAGLAVDEVHRLQKAAYRSDRKRAIRVADLGTGSGAVGLSVAKECVTAEVVLTDICPHALAVARANLAGLGRQAVRVTVRQGSWYEALPEQLVGKLDVIVSNPPYVCDEDVLSDEVACWEPELALRGGADGLDSARCILAEAASWLSAKGSVLLELAPTQMPTAADIAQKNGLVVEAVHTDLAGRKRVLHCRKM